MSDLVRNIFRFAIFILIQVFVLSKIPHLHKFITPFVYFLFLLWLPYSVSRFWLMVIGFLFGLSLDYFTMTPGLHAAACVMLAYFRPFVINLLMPKETADFNYREPSPKAMGRTPYFVYVFICYKHFTFDDFDCLNNRTERDSCSLSCFRITNSVRTRRG